MKGTACTKAAGESPREPERRYPALDGLRGAAILLVVADHYKIVPYLGGVVLFFVLSGFLLGGILMSKRGAPNYYKAFYARRACRILPLYLLSVLAFFSILASLPLSWPFGAPPAGLFENPLPLWSYLTFAQNLVMAYQDEAGAGWLVPTWSLAIEEQFCLTLPILVALISPKRLPYVLLTGVLAVLLFRMATYGEFGPGNIAALVLFPARADALFLGVLCAWVVREPWGLAFLQRNSKTLYYTLAFLAAVSCWFLGLLIPWLPEPPRWGVNVLGNSSLALFYGCVLLVAVTERRGLLSLAMRLKPLRLLAPIAFGVFLFHVPVLAAVSGLAEGDIARPEAWLDVAMKMSAFAATVALATVSWIFFESRIVAWGRSFRYEGPRVAMTQSDQGSGVATEVHKASPAPSAGSTRVFR